MIKNLSRSPLPASLTSMVLFTVVALPGAVRQALSSHQLVSWLATAVVYASLAARRRFPLSTTAIAVVGSIVLMADGMVYPLTLPALFCALYWVALGSSQSRALAVGVATKAALLSGSLVTHPGVPGFVIVLWAALAVTTGSAARSHRAYVAAMKDEANRRVTEERLRIARELHDAVGHHVALISVQAGALACLLDDEDRPRALEAVAHIQHASEEALEELRLTVGLLRDPAAAEPEARDEYQSRDKWEGRSEWEGPPEPLPGLDRLGDLIGSFAGAGLRVSREVTGRPRPLPGAVELTAYRVIQESLTNTRKHAACDTAVVRLGYAPEALSLTVEDDGDPVTSARQGTREGTPRETRQGHGIVGMRERVAAVGGQLAVGPRPHGGYRVFAELPIPLRASGIEDS